MNIFAKLRRAQRRRDAVRQLRALPPELLSDIGIEPDQIDEAVASIAAGAPPAAGGTASSVEAPVFTHGDWPYSSRRAA